MALVQAFPGPRPVQRKSRRPWRCARRLAAAGTVATMLVAGSAWSAQAADTYPRPADGVFSITGHGNGHGHGMSQYGALGAARAGLAWQDIIDFYYPGTTQGTIGNSTIKVRVAGLGSAVEAYPASGLSITWNQTDVFPLTTTKDGKTIARWRINPGPKVAGTPTRFRLEYLPAGSSTWLLYGNAPASRTGAFVNPTSGTVLTRRGSDQVLYRGQVRAVLVGADGAESLIPVVALPMESYLRTVVPGEVFASWPAATLGAQAVAARSYAANSRNSPLTSEYDVYDDTRSQVFKPTAVNGVSNEASTTNAAISATANVAALYGGKPAFTQFSASDGGWSSDGGKPYLVAQRDGYDAVADNPYHTWTGTVTVAQVEASYPSIGSFRSLTINQRNGLGDDGGRVISATLTGSAGSVTRTGEQLRSLFGRGMSDWFTPARESAASFPRDFTQDGRMDVLGVDSSTGALRVYPGNGAGGWLPMIVAEPSGWKSYAKVLTAGSWDSDTINDVLVQDTAGYMYLRRGLGNGKLGTPVRIGSGWGVHNTVLPVGDFDGDGLTDLIARHGSTGALWLYSGNGTGGFKGYRVIGSGWQGFTSILGPGDFDGDGFVDVLGRKSDGSLVLYPGDGAGGWKPARRVGTGWQGFTALTAGGDFNGDKKPDVLARTADGNLYLYSGNGTGGWRTRSQVGHGWQTLSTILQ